MQTRRLGKTNLQVSEIGFGAFQLGNKLWGDMTDQSALDLVHGAIDQGCNLFDTAPNYGNGNSERLLGLALQGRRDKVVLVSKFGHKVDGGHDFSAEGLRQSLEGSLQRLQTDYIDVLLIHSPPREVLSGEHEVWQALRDAQRQGKIGYLGASVDYADEVDTLLQDSGAQVVELLFNILHQDVRQSFAGIAEQDIGVLTKVPLDSGWLSGNYSADTQFGDIRSRWTRTDIERRAQCVDDVREILGPELSVSQPLAQTALAFLLSYDVVSSVIPGIRTQSQLNSALAAAGQRLPSEQVVELQRYWQQMTINGEHKLPW